MNAAAFGWARGGSANDMGVYFSISGVGDTQVAVLTVGAKAAADKGIVFS